ncbi:MAG: Crp/Fnr family transcriptional regulator [Bacteroidetes bacterium]|nr:Crp/Fnr family transcriptional regulator [Bacteroidales bacterium]MBU1011131.1 Crp/Fnr family transcriptional regulator [Bacteroidota bacterium]
MPAKIQPFGFSDPGLIEKLESCRRMTIPAGQKILDEGDVIVLIPFVTDGQIRVVRNDETGREILLYTIFEGESCALSISSGFNGQRSNAVAITENNTEVLLIPAASLRSWFAEHAEFRQFIMNLFHKRFNEMINVVDAIAFKSMDYRLLRLLKIRQTESGNTINTTHQQLANELGTVREVVSRLLKQLEKQGVIKNHRGKVEILSDL